MRISPLFKGDALVSVVYNNLEIFPRLSVVKRPQKEKKKKKKSSNAILLAEIEATAVCFHYLLRFFVFFS